MTETAAITQPLGREYRRVSVDRSGVASSPHEQGVANGLEAARWGIAVGVHYEDVNRSASRYATKDREDFERLIGDLRADTFGAQYLILWESSRGSRKVSEWCLLIELLEERKVKVLVTEHHRIYDPSNSRDWRSLMDDAVDSEYESRKTSGRTNRGQGERAALGRPHGKIPFGYRRTYDPNTGRLVGQESHPDQAPIIFELFDRIRKGHSFRAICKDFAARGVERHSGGAFTQTHLRTLALNPAYAGIRVHSPGRKSGHEALGEDATRNVAQWEAIVPMDLWLAVQRIISAPERKTWRPGRDSHFLSGFVRCDACGAPVAAKTRHGRNLYCCNAKGDSQVDRAELDDLAERAILAFLGRSDHLDVLNRPVDTAELARVRVKLAEARAEWDDLGDSGISAALAARKEPAILARIKELEIAEDDLITPSELAGLIKAGPGVEGRWRPLPMSTRRAIARILLSSKYLGQLRIIRVGPTGGVRVPATRRVVWINAEGHRADTAWVFESRDANGRLPGGTRPVLMGPVTAAEAALVTAEAAGDQAAVEEASAVLEAARAERAAAGRAAASVPLGSDDRARVADLLG